MKEIQEYKHLFFDLDDTLTSSRSRVDDDMHTLLSVLPVDLVVVSGAATEQIGTQLPNLPFYRMGQNGNHTTKPDGTLIWEKCLTSGEEDAIYAHISELLTAADFEVSNEKDLIENRKSQISYSTIGHHASKERKHVFDPDSAVRNSLLTKFPLNSNSVEVRIGGTTCFDYFRIGSNKGNNVREFIALMGWDPLDCVYFGDKLMPGGNDETVVGIIDTIAVKSHRDTFGMLQAAFQK